MPTFTAGRPLRPCGVNDSIRISSLVSPDRGIGLLQALLLGHGAHVQHHRLAALAADGVDAQRYVTAL